MSYVNDTHGASGDGWYGFDLDGTLARYEEWEGIDHIGEPVKPMVDLIRKMHDEGKVVKILTARVTPRDRPDLVDNPFIRRGPPAYAHAFISRCGGDHAKNFYVHGQWSARDFVADWCLRHLGFLPDITHEKDPSMLTLYDDRVKQVVPNRGVLVEDVAARGPSHLAWFALGFGLCALLGGSSASGHPSDGSRHSPRAAFSTWLSAGGD